MKNKEIIPHGDQSAQRRAKLTELRSRAVAYPNDFRRDALAAALRAHYDDLSAEELQDANRRACVAGRIMSRRIQGRVSFVHIQDMSGQLQLFVQRDALPEGTYNQEFKKWDIGDIVGATGVLFKTKTGELTLKVDEIRLLVKSLRPLPEKFHGVTDPEIRYRQRYLDLIRDQHKPEKPPLDLKVHEEVVVEGVYRRRLISYAVESDERAHAYLGIPLDVEKPAPAIIALHGTYKYGKKRVAGLIDNPDKAYLDHLCRRGYVVIAPEHFVSGHRIPSEGHYETGAFHRKHPEWTAVGKFTYEHSIAIDVLQGLDEVDDDQIGALGHSLGGHGTIFLAAYDDRIKASACNCGGSFFRHNPRVEAWSRDHWYVYFKPIREGLLNKEMPPIDFHEIMALIAPRAFLDLSGLKAAWVDPQRPAVLRREQFERNGPA